MKILMTLQVRDEEDIIAANIDFHLAQGVDFIIVTDNLSVDRTRDILSSYERRGLVRCIWQPEDTHSQGKWVTHMARLAAVEHGADWVINSDADEFWFPAQGNLKDVLGGVPAKFDAVDVERTNFVPPWRDAVNEPFWTNMMIREVRSLNVLGEPLPSKICHRAFDNVIVDDGNHSVSRQGATLASTRLSLTILHFPMRSYRQFANKIAKGGAALKRNPALGPGTGHAWRHMHDLWLEGQLEAFYQTAAPDAAEVIAGLADGKYVRCNRLRAFMSSLSPGNERHG